MKKLCLLVDDDPTFNWISAKMIEKVYPGLTMISCANGKEALDYLNENFTQETFYHILLDINMPRLNGWEFIEALKTTHTVKSENVSIYIVSSSTDESDIQRANGLNLVKGYFKKPVSLEDIKSIFE